MIQRIYHVFTSICKNFKKEIRLSSQYKATSNINNHTELVKS